MKECGELDSCVTASGVTPLLAAAHSGSTECALLAMSEDWLDQPDVRGATPLWAAVRNRDVAMTALLLDAGANPEAGQVGEHSTPELLSTWRAEDPDMPF